MRSMPEARVRVGKPSHIKIHFSTNRDFSSLCTAKLDLNTPVASNSRIRDNSFDSPASDTPSIQRARVLIDIPFATCIYNIFFRSVLEMHPIIGALAQPVDAHGHSESISCA